MNDADITLNIEGSPVDKETSAGWKVEAFILDGAARGADAPSFDLALPADAVLELELANGTRILTAAGDAHHYLGAPVGRGDGKTDAVTVGQSLRFSGPRLPEGATREGFTAWVIKGLRVFRQGPAGMTALIAAGTFQDARLEQRNGLYRCAGDRLSLSPVEQLPASADPSLIFLHGTASSTEGSFGDLWTNETYRRQLADAYGTRIFALEHRSLTESPIANVLALVKALPKEGAVRLHLVSHSRGGLVGELLARANRVGEEPFTDDDVKRFLGQAQRLGRAGFEADAERLRELNREMGSRSIQVERFVRVACPARGTTLAAGKLDRWATVMFNLLGKGLDWGAKAAPVLAPVAKGYDLLQNFVRAVVRERADASILPGLEAMTPDSPLIDLLNAPDVRIGPPLHVLAGDFRGDGLLPWLGDCVSEIFYGGETDLVVNTPSMSGGAVRKSGVKQKSLSGPEVHHLSYFRRDESVLPLLAALRGEDRDFVLLDGPSRIEIDRGGKETKFKDKAPIVFLLPGIMGSHLRIGRNRIWFEPASLCAGEMEQLQINAANVRTDGWMDRSYEGLARFLADSHEVRPFVYDWRKSLTEAAADFGHELDLAMKEARSRGTTVRVVAHSMGGLVARLALKNRWEQFKSLPGGRLLQLGTPNRGSHSIAAVLLGRDDFVQMIEHWFDWKHDMKGFLAIVRDFPGVLELLPWGEQAGPADDGRDYFSPEVWAQFFAEDQDPKRDASWVTPEASALQAARKTIAAVCAAGLDPECTLYVAGQAPTPVAVRVERGVVEIGWSEEGDGRVPWKTGIPAGIPVWYADAAHGDLAGCRDAFAAYQQLLETGTTRLLPRTSAGVSRGETAPVFRARTLSATALYPTADEVMAAAGGARPGRRAKAKGESPAMVEVVHGSLAGANSPVLIGAYAGLPLRGSLEFLDQHLEGRMERAQRIGRFPCQPDDAMVFRQADETITPAGAIVVGLGPVGDLLPGTLTLALTQGLLEYARIKEQQSAAEPARPEQLAVSALLVGTGFAGLTVEAGTRCLLDALRRANRILQQNAFKTRVGRLTVYEEVLGRAIAAVQALRDLISETRFAGVADFDGRLHDGRGGYCGRTLAGGGQSGTIRVQIEVEAQALRFTVVTDRARNVVTAEPNQRQAVDGLIRCATATTRDQPGLSRALFELLAPNSIKEEVADLRTLMLSVDPEAATYPWELLRDTDQAGEPPLAARVELVRQLASGRGRARTRLVEAKRMLAVGDTQSEMAELPGAQVEAREAADCFVRAGCEVNSLCRATPLEVFDALFNGQYRFMHLAGHGVINDKKTGSTGMVLGPDTFLTSAQVSKLRRVPEFVFINCCHLGNMTPDARMGWGELAANLATAFIEMGCKAVIAAGWAVDDQAAGTFARVFYEAMFRGARFGQALLQARFETYRLFPFTNTWGAFQAYGDERYCFPDVDAKDEAEAEYVHPSHLVADLEMLAARLRDATPGQKKDYYRKRLTAIEKAARGSDFQHAGVREKLGRAWVEMDDPARAIEHYRAALAFEDAGVSLHSLELLAGLEMRHGAALLDRPDKARKAELRLQGEEFMATGRARLEQLLKIGATTHRWTLLGSCWKRWALAQAEQGTVEDAARWLTEMGQAYWSGAENGRNRSGQWDCSLLFNALDAAFLAAVRGERALFDARAGQLPDLLRAAQGCIPDGRQDDSARNQNGFLPALITAESRRIDALWACCTDNRVPDRITEPARRDVLVGLYRDALAMAGNAEQRDAALEQLRFLTALLPENKPGAAIKTVLLEVLAAVGDNPATPETPPPKKKRTTKKLQDAA
jgi:pimeloyl-ACP methyl ester carboxylesterase